jgi:hypothetical protein
MRMTVLLAPALFTACSSADTDQPEQSSAAVAAAFGAVLDGCAAGLTADGAIDEAALGEAGWTASERHQGTGYRSSTWHRDGVTGRIELVRYGADLADTCSLDARTSGSDGASAVRAALERRLGPPALQGAMPQGGDQLTPRATDDRTGYHWSLPQHDVYLTDFDGQSVRIEVVAMPSRDALDAYSPDRPESRIITKDPLP